MDEIKMLTAIQGTAGKWRITAIGADRVPGNLDERPEVDQVTDFMSGQGWSVSHDHQPGDGSRSITLVRKPPESELAQLFRHLGVTPPVELTAADAAQVAQDIRNVISH